MSLTYTTQLDEHRDVIPCNSCGCEVPTDNFPRPPDSEEKEPRPLCEFCSTTLASRHNEYPPADMEDRLRNEIWQAAACVYNLLKFGRPL